MLGLELGGGEVAEGGVPASRVYELRYPGLLHTEPLPDTDPLDLNTHKAPFDDVRVRQALDFAIDRDAIADLYGGLDDATPPARSSPTRSPVTFPTAYSRNPPPRGLWTGPDIGRVRRLIASSRTRGVVVTVLTEASSGPWDELVGHYMLGLLRRLGYRARLRVVPTSQLLLSWAAWHAPARLINESEFCDPAVDCLATQLQLASPAAADRLWARADRLITNLAPWIPTVTQTETNVVSQRVGDYQYVPTIGALLDQLWVR